VAEAGVAEAINHLTIVLADPEELVAVVEAETQINMRLPLPICEEQTELVAVVVAQVMVLGSLHLAVVAGLELSLLDTRFNTNASI
jgi:hypothetical protein